MRARWVLPLLAAATPVILGLCLLLGPAGLGLPDWTTPGGRAILMLRVNRVLAGLVVGGALATAGAVLQALLRNPLAEPYVLGVSSGAALGAAASILLGLAALGPFTIPAAAFACGAATLWLVYQIARSGEAPSIYGLILSGVIVSSVCSGLLMFLISIAPVEGMHSILWWMLGNLEMASPRLLLADGILAAAGFALVWALSPELNALTLGREAAHSLGVRTRFAVGAGLAIATLMTAAAVGTAGLIGFVGLVVPHVTRSLTGPDHRRMLPSAALGGGLFLALCDALARTVLAPREIPVGVITALVGGPFFLSILRSRRKAGWIG